MPNLKRHYGTSFHLTELGNTILQHFPRTVDRFADEIELVVAELSGIQVVELERLAPALDISIHSSETDVEVRARSTHELKPHTALEDARSAIPQSDDL